MDNRRDIVWLGAGAAGRLSLLLLWLAGGGCSQGSGISASPAPALQAGPAAEAASPGPIRWLSPQQAREEIRTNGELFLLCVADRELYDKGHIDGSVLIPAMGVGKFIENNTLWPEINRHRVPRKDQPLLIYCYWKDCVCPSMPTWSDYALKALQQKGFTNLAVITGGMPRWTKEGLPTQKGPR